MNKWFVLLSPLLFTTCLSAPFASEYKETSAYTRAHLPFTVEAQACEGSCLVQRRTSQKITVQIPDSAIRVDVRSCHRREVFKKPAKPFVYMYQPQMWIENWDSCILEIYVLTNKGNKYASFIDFSSNETMPGSLQCNARKIDSGTLNASFCQSQAGLYQRISFDKPVTVYNKANCAAPIGTDRKAFEIPLNSGFCIYLFKDGTGNSHRLTTYGYTELEKEE
jgi:hypothetical protein